MYTLRFCGKGRRHVVIFCVVSHICALYPVTGKYAAFVPGKLIREHEFLQDVLRSSKSVAFYASQNVLVIMLCSIKCSSNGWGLGMVQTTITRQKPNKREAGQYKSTCNSSPARRMGPVLRVI